MCMAAIYLLLSYTDYHAIPTDMFKANREQLCQQDGGSLAEQA